MSRLLLLDPRTVSFFRALIRRLRVGSLLVVPFLVPPSYGTSLDWVGELSFAVDPAGCGGGPTGGSDVWGYTAPDGTDYAIMGVYEGVAVVRIPDLEIIDVIPGPQDFDCYYHRDIKTYGHYAYVTNEMAGTNEGLMILDLQFLPDRVEFVGSYTDVTITSHNLSIDTATGYAYLQDGGGVRFVSLSDPTQPVDVHYISALGTHDVFAQDDLLYLAEGFMSRFSIWDVSDKLNPVRLSLVDIPAGGYCHNIWASEDGSLVMTTEETTDKTTKLWNTSDPTDPQLMGEWLGDNGLAHNTHLMGSRAFVSHYSYGVSVVDLTDPNAPVEIGHYDTYPDHDDAAFVGCWGAFPYTAGGYVYASDIEGDLILLRWDEPASSPEPGLSSFDFQAFPNPSDAGTTLRYRVESESQIRLGIYTAGGKRVRQLMRDRVAGGSHEVYWDGSDASGRALPTGTYFLRLEVDGDHGFQVTKKLVRTR